MITHVIMGGQRNRTWNQIINISMGSSERDLRDIHIAQIASLPEVFNAGVMPCIDIISGNDF
ncbi:MAG: hypothetical protein LBH28_00650 [Oscillospiraceae bacterium]|nr:hypothetical protein [Oscillospiraceae bacterium]